jgi:DNA-binding response OmpR family regulator
VTPTEPAEESSAFPVAGTKILVVEDEPRFARPLVAALRRHGYEVLHVTDARSALEAPPCDLILLDLGLPDRDGMRVCQEIRERGDTPIVVLTARAEEVHRVAGLRLGADDYVVKPFGFAELEARIQAVLRRCGQRQPEMYHMGALVVDLTSRTAYARGEPVPLARKEFLLLAALAAQPGVVHRRERLLLDVWNTSWQGTSRTLDVHIGALRSKLAGVVRLETVRGVGYRIVEQ